jgi:hypothetical protein
MHHLSFGRKERRGLGNKNTILRVFVRPIIKLFFDDAPDAAAGGIVAG